MFWPYQVLPGSEVVSVEPNSEGPQVGIVSDVPDQQAGQLEGDRQSRQAAEHYERSHYLEFALRLLAATPLFPKGVEEVPRGSDPVGVGLEARELAEESHEAAHLPHRQFPERVLLEVLANFG